MKRKVNVQNFTPKFTSIMMVQILLSALFLSVRCTGADAASCNDGVCNTISFQSEAKRCTAFDSLEKCGAAKCDWVPYKGGAFCTKKFIIERLSDEEAHSIISDDDIRKWGAQNCHKYGWQARSGALPRLFDTFIFYNEIELLEIRLNEVYDVVDKLMLVEADRTFTYKPKPLHFKNRADEFDAFAQKITSYNCELPEFPLGAHDDYKRGWNREHFQRECIRTFLNAMPDGERPLPSDIILLSDVDEIPRREPLLALKSCAVDPAELSAGFVFVQRQHAYTFYYELSEWSDWPGYALWPGTVAVDAATFLKIGPGTARFMRDDRVKPRRVYDAGWHFSPFPFGDASRILDKLGAWAHQEERRKTSEYRDEKRWRDAMTKGHSCRRLDRRSDYLALPLYVRENRDKYASLLLDDNEYID